MDIFEEEYISKDTEKLLKDMGYKRRKHNVLVLVTPRWSKIIDANKK